MQNKEFKLIFKMNKYPKKFSLKSYSKRSTIAYICSWKN